MGRSREIVEEPSGITYAEAVISGLREQGIVAVLGPGGPVSLEELLKAVEERGFVSPTEKGLLETGRETIQD